MMIHDKSEEDRLESHFGGRLNISRAEWFGIVCWATVVTIVFFFTLWQAEVTKKELKDHRIYIQERDIRWEKWESSVLENQLKILEMQSRILKIIE